MVMMALLLTNATVEAAGVPTDESSTPLAGAAVAPPDCAVTNATVGV